MEAEAIVAEIRALVHATKGPQQSIGVVTFNQPQQEMILDLLEETGDQQIIHLLKPDTENGIFVKNLENVQGDERDVILFSTAFSKRPGERAMPLNFGPLTRFGGEKRLNVAVTRARAKVIVFTSFDPSDIELSRTRSVGMAHLKAYLEAAAVASGVGGAAAVVADRQPEKIQETIASELHDRGLEVALDYGLSEFVVDIAVRDSKSPRWQVAVMLDSPRWARRPTVADRELTPSLLDSMMGWSSCRRVWLPEWIKDREAVVNRIVAAVEQANADEAKRAEEAAAAIVVEQPVEPHVEVIVTPPGDTTSVTAEPFAPIHEPEPSLTSVPVDVVAPLAHVATSVSAVAPSAGRGVCVPYVAAPTTAVGSRDELDHPQWHSVRTRIQDAVRESIEVEGPIALNRLVRNVVHRFGFDRAAAKRQQVVRDFVPEDLVYDDELGTFVWPADLDRAEWTGFRTTPSGFFRPLDEVSGEEIINALVYAARNGVYDQEALMRDTLAFFDQYRLTKQSADRLQLCISKAERLGKLVRRGAGYVSAT